MRRGNILISVVIFLRESILSTTTSSKRDDARASDARKARHPFPFVDDSRRSQRVFVSDESYHGCCLRLRSLVQWHGDGIKKKKNYGWPLSYLLRQNRKKKTTRSVPDLSAWLSGRLYYSRCLPGSGMTFHVGGGSIVRVLGCFQGRWQSKRA